MIRRLFFVTLISPFISSPAQAIYDKSVPSGYVAKLLSNGSENYFSEMNLGWYDEQYAELKAKIDPRRSYIVIHNRIPSVPLDLRSPNHFRSSAMNAGLLSLGKLNIGHIMVGWHCEINGRLYEGNTGITGEQENQQRAMAKAGWGLTGLFSIFKDGHVQTPLLTRSVFHEAREKNLPIATMAFEVEPEECGRMLNFLQAFLSSEKQP